jgi:hypothetical protein
LRSSPDSSSRSVLARPWFPARPPPGAVRRRVLHSGATPFLPQRRGAAAARPPSPSSPGTRPSSGGRKPQWGWLVLPPPRTAPLPLLNPRRGASVRNSPPCPRSAAASGQVVAAATARPASDPWVKGATGSFLFSPRSPLGPRAHVGLGVRASRSARPRASPRGLARLDRRRGRLAGLVEALKERDRKGREGRLTRGALVAGVEGETVGPRYAGGPMAAAGWAGREATEVKSAHPS